MPKQEIILYQPDEQSTAIDVRVEDETVWLTQAQMVELFQSTKQNISLHINNVYKEGELQRDTTVKEYLTVQQEGSRQVKRKIIYYNLDVIISVGYRVKSHRGTQFRIWANEVIKDYLIRGYTLNRRVDKIERKLEEHDQKFDILVKANLPRREGIFYDGQIFDAWKFTSELIKTANHSIILIDNYVDESVLDLFTKRQEKVDALIYTKTMTKALKTDLKKHNAQYPKITIKTFQKSHDRFLIIDRQTIYHIGASLKDLGKKWFAFSKMNLDIADILHKLEC